MQGREEDMVNGLTRAGGKHMQVMPDGSLTVTQETGYSGISRLSGTEVGTYVSNRVVSQK